MGAETNQINVDASEEELPQQKKSRKVPGPMVTRGVLAKYAHNVGDASHGC